MMLIPFTNKRSSNHSNRSSGVFFWLFFQQNTCWNAKHDICYVLNKIICQKKHLS